MSSMTSFIWGQLSQTPSHLTQSSTGASARQLPPWPDWHRKYGTTASWPSTQSSRSTEPASWVLSCMAASPGHCAPDRSESSMLFTCAASHAFWTSPGRTRSQTTLSWKELDAPACSRCWNRRMRWLGPVVRMNCWRIPKDLLFGELVQGKRPTGRPQLRFKDVCKRDQTALNIDQNNSEATAWRQTVQKGLSNFEGSLAHQHEEKTRKKAAAHADRQASDFICALCHRDCHSRIWLASHTRRCTRMNT